MPFKCASTFKENKTDSSINIHYVTKDYFPNNQTTQLKHANAMQPINRFARQEN